MAIVLELKEMILRIIQIRRMLRIIPDNPDSQGIRSHIFRRQGIQSASNKPIPMVNPRGFAQNQAKQRDVYMWYTWMILRSCICLFFWFNQYPTSILSHVRCLPKLCSILVSGKWNQLTSMFLSQIWYPLDRVIQQITTKWSWIFRDGLSHSKFISYLGKPNDSPEMNSTTVHHYI